MLAETIMTPRMKLRVVCGLLLVCGWSDVASGDIISFTNPSPITIRDRRPAEPYGAVINVSNVVGNIENITVSLLGVSHQYPNDMAAVVVAPSGTSVMLFSGPGFNIPVENLNWVFDDNAAATLPEEGALASGTFRPGLEQYDENFPAPGPGGKLTDNDPTPWAFSFAPWLNQDPNGDWRLFVIDSQLADSGSISGGWSMSFQVAAVPEPASAGLSMLSLLALGLRRRRWRAPRIPAEASL